MQLKNRLRAQVTSQGTVLRKVVLTSAHLPLARAPSHAPLNCKGRWELQSSYEPKGIKERVLLNSEPFLPQALSKALKAHASSGKSVHSRSRIRVRQGRHLGCLIQAALAPYLGHSPVWCLDSNFNLPSQRRQMRSLTSTAACTLNLRQIPSCTLENVKNLMLCGFGL